MKTPAQGIGRDTWPDRSSDYCTTRLRHVIKMGDLGVLDDDPDAAFPGVASLTTVEVMGHELGHQWLAMIDFAKADGQRHCVARAYTPTEGSMTREECDGLDATGFGVHWSRYFDSPSVMYGNVMRDLGGGRFELSNPGRKFGDLDQYLMGLRDPAEVGDQLVVDPGDLFDAASYPIARGTTQTIQGERIDFTVHDVIRAMGPRVPAREACHKKGAPPTAAEIAKVDALRRRWETFYADATDRRGSFDTTLDGSGPGTVECPPEPTIPARDGGVLDAHEVSDAGEAPDAATPDAATPDAGDRDAGPRPLAVDAGGEAGPRVLLTDDCACTSTHRGRGGPRWGLLLAAVAIRRRRTHRRDRSASPR